MMYCQWFARCTNQADYIVSHPAIAKGVPCCIRCFERMGVSADRIIERISA